MERETDEKQRVVFIFNVGAYEQRSRTDGIIPAAVHTIDCFPSIYFSFYIYFFCCYPSSTCFLTAPSLRQSRDGRTQRKKKKKKKKKKKNRWWKACRLQSTSLETCHRIQVAILCNSMMWSRDHVLTANWWDSPPLSANKEINQFLS